MASLWQRLGRTGDAIGALKTSLADGGGKYPGVYGMLADLYRDLGNASAAEVALERLVQLEPDRGEHYLELGSILEEKGDVSAARAIYEKAAESTGRCAGGVVADIRKRRFWPPSTRVRYDDFEGLFPADADACFDADALKNKLKAMRG